MEYIVITLLAINFIILLVILFKNNGSNDTTERMGRLETNIVREFGDFKNDLTRSLNEDFIKLNEQLENRLRHINDAVNERLDENFEKTNKTFTNVLERLSKIDEAQKKIDTLSSDIVSLQSVLTDKKTRGIYGEVNLKNIMENVFGENNKKIFQLQYSFENGTIVDCALFAPEPLGLIGIDSKFPLENYSRMVDRTLSASERNEATKLFKSDVKKHIDAISSKYIIPGVTSNQAIMFLPAEAIFAEINAYHTDLIEYAYKKRVWLTSPTTLISTLTTIQVIMMNIERDKYTKVIHNELKLLDEEFKRYKDRWDKLSRSIETVGKDVKELHTTSEKITKRFNSINQVDIKELVIEEKE
jgi:DNA recombination protein RmuC